MMDPVMPLDSQIYVDEFVHEAAKRGIYVNKDRIHIKFKELKGTASGTAYKYTVRYRVKINESSWKEYGLEINSSYEHYYKQYLIFHELGHAVLNRNHFDKMVDGRYVSIMAPGKMHYTIHPTHMYYVNYWEEYMDELFLGKY